MTFTSDAFIKGGDGNDAFFFTTSDDPDPKDSRRKV
jgi:hypothetical protein